MADIKRYYWLKLKEDFFDDDVINWIEDQKNGKEYCLFYLKLCLKSLKNNGVLIRNVGTLLVPYDTKKLADITNTPEDTVIVAMSLFKKTGLVEVMENGALYLSQLQDMVGSESSWAKKKREQRLTKGQSEDNVPQMSDRERDRDRDRDKSKEIEKDVSSLSPILEEIKTKWESTFHPLMKADELETLEAYIQDYGRMGVLNAIETAGKRKNLNRATLSPRYLLPILKNPTSKPEEPRRNVIPMITDRNEKEYWARLRREDEARQAEAKRLGEDDPYGIYGESS